MGRIPKIIVRQRNDSRVDQSKLIEHNDRSIGVASQYRTNIRPLFQRKHSTSKRHSFQKEEKMSIAAA